MDISITQIARENRNRSVCKVYSSRIKCAPSRKAGEISFSLVVGGERRQRQRVNPCCQLLGQCSVDETLSRQLRPANSAATIITVKCVSPSGCAPACPAWRAEFIDDIELKWAKCRSSLSEIVCLTLIAFQSDQTAVMRRRQETCQFIDHVIDMLASRIRCCPILAGAHPCSHAQLGGHKGSARYPQPSARSGATA